MPHHAREPHAPSQAPAAPHRAEEGSPRPGAEERNYALCVAYDGSAFQGWQIQPHGPSVQGTLEAALSTALRRPVRVYGSGRTDAGVHALNQIANFHAPPGLDLYRLRGSVNGIVAAGPAGRSVAVKAIVPVSPDFHARHSATGKVYRYRIHNRPWPPVFTRHGCWWIRPTLDVPAMRRAAAALEGTHDFSSFRAADCAAPSPVRHVTRIALTEAEGGDGALSVEMAASGFLQHMARIVTGTLVSVGLGRLRAEDMAAIRDARRRDAAGPTAPGRGLYLVRVDYDRRRFPELADLHDL